MTLRQIQSKFARDIALLINYAYRQGYEVTFGDAYRDPRLHGNVGERKGYGRAKSLHKQRLAVDLNLFKDGKYLSSTESHRQLGEFWEKLDSSNSWGGRFNDGNHYSREYRGMR